MTRFLAFTALAICILGPSATAGQQPVFRGGGRCRPRVRHRDGSGRPAGHDAHAGRLRVARRREAAADHVVRQHPSAHSAHRDAGRLRQHGGQPAAPAYAARSNFSRGCGPTTSRGSARSATTSRSALRSRAIPTSSGRRCRTTIAPDAPTPLWRAVDEALDAFGERGRSARCDSRAERREGQRADRVQHKVLQPGARSSTARA